MISKKDLCIYALFCYSIAFSSCDTFYSFGVINNHTRRTIKVAITDRNLGDSDLYSARVRTIKLIPMGTTKLYLGFGLPQKPKEHKWYVKFYDADSLSKCYHNHSIVGSMQKAFLKEDTITEAQILQKNISLIYSENNLNEPPK